MAGQWGAAGVQTIRSLIPDNATRAVVNEMRHTFSGVLGGPLRDTHESLEAFIGSQSGTEEDALSIHLSYNIAQQTVALRKGVRGPAAVSTNQLASAWNIHTWEID